MSALWTSWGFLGGEVGVVQTHPKKKPPLRKVGIGLPPPPEIPTFSETLQCVAPLRFVS